jgi:hypothetical protein
MVGVHIADASPLVPSLPESKPKLPLSSPVLPESGLVGANVLESEDEQATKRARHEPEAKAARRILRMIIDRCTPHARGKLTAARALRALVAHGGPHLRVK